MDNISTVVGIQYCGGCSVLWGITLVLWVDNISTVVGIQYCGGIPSVLWGDTFSTVGGITAVHVGDSFSTMGDTFSTMEIVQYCGG